MAFQFCYTTLFGWFATWLLLRSGHLVSLTAYPKRGAGSCLGLVRQPFCCCNAARLSKNAAQGGNCSCRLRRLPHMRFATSWGSLTLGVWPNMHGRA